MLLGVLHPDGTYYYQNGSLKPLPYFTIIAEHFGRLARMIKNGVTPKIRLNLETEFYNEPKNNVNVIGELTGTDAKLKSETILIGAHFDSWHSGTGATDNGANSVVLVEALRILKQIGYKPKRTIKMGLWGGEEQAFLGSAAYAKKHFGKLNEKPNRASKKIAVYLNLDNGAGAIRGLYLQKNEFARPVFKKVFSSISNLSEGALTIENTLSTDHETFDHYNIPSFQFIQDDLTYGNVTHHTQLDVVEYVPEEDIMKNAVILAWTIYSLSENDKMVPRKVKG
jgi:Zn-dependent M28 family amino/carboxypeptidase